MDKEIEDKIYRFVGLSKKFSKSDLFEKDSNKSQSFGYNLDHIGGLSSGTSLWFGDRELYIDKNNQVKAKDNTILTRAEIIRAEAEVVAILADEFDEYKTLQTDLMDYFKASNKLTNNNDE